MGLRWACLSLPGFPQWALDFGLKGLGCTDWQQAFGAHGAENIKAPVIRQLVSAKYSSRLHMCHLLQLPDAKELHVASRHEYDVITRAPVECDLPVLTLVGSLQEWHALQHKLRFIFHPDVAVQVQIEGNKLPVGISQSGHALTCSCNACMNGVG